MKLKYQNFVLTLAMMCGLSFLQGISAQVPEMTTNALWAMGDNIYGQLGDGSTEQNTYFTNFPEQIVGNNVAAIAAGSYVSMFLLTNGSLWVAGLDDVGELGDGLDGNNVQTNVPEMIVASNVTAIAGGLRFGMFLKSDGTLWGMGDNSNGQLGDGLGGSGVFTNRPEMITNGVTAVACGFYHTVFLKTNGSLWVMGSQTYGQLGDGNTKPGYYVNKPEMIEPSGVKTIAAGATTSMFIMSNGTMWVAGYDNYGQLGDTNGGVGVTVNVPELITNGVAAISGGGFHSMFVLSNGSLWVMGANNAGQLGDGTANAQSYVPEMIEPGGVAAISAGYEHSLFVKSNGSLWGMGADFYGELGNGLSGGVGGVDAGTNLPMQIVGSNVTAIAAGYYFSMFIGGGAVTTYTYTVSSSSAGGGTVSSSGTGVAGSTVTVTATPASGYAFAFWTSNNVNVGSSTNYTVTLTTNVALVANFAPFFTYTASPSPAGDGTVSAGGTNVAGSIITVTATNNSGYAFSYWTSNNINVGSSTNYTFALNTNVTLVANFVPMYSYAVSPFPYYDGTVSAGGMGAAGSAITVKATNNSGFAFAYWTSNGVTVAVTTNYTFMLNTNVTLVANFQLACTLAVSPSPANGGTVSGGGTFAQGSTNTVTATARRGFTFTNWTQGGIVASLSSNYTLVLNSNETLVANFVTNYELGVNASPVNGGTVSGGGIYPYGSSIQVTATTNGGFEFIGWSGDATGTSNPLNVTVYTNLSITANFASNSTKLTVTIITNGAGTVSPDLTGRPLTAGSTFTLRASPTEGGHELFSNWTGSITTNKNPLAITVESNLVLQANFVHDPFPSFAGTYNGLFIDTNGVVTEQTAGMLKGLHVTSSGTYSGSLLFNGGSNTISGAFNLGGLASNSFRVQERPYQLVMALNGNNLFPQVTGTVAGANWTANLVADLASNTLPSAEYTMLMPPDTNNAPPTNSPGGDGYALITNHAGTVKITGALADGTGFNQTVSISPDGFVPVYANLYSGKGLLLGWINLDLANTSAIAATGLTWFHPERNSGLYQQMEFTNILLGSQILLSEWIDSPENTVLTNLTNLSILGVINDTNAVNIHVTTTAAGKVTGKQPSPEGQPLVGTINAKTGLLTVPLVIGASHVTGHGAILLNHTNGGGFFLTTTNGQAIELLP